MSMWQGLTSAYTTTNTATTAVSNWVIHHPPMWHSNVIIEKKQSPQSFYKELTIETEGWLRGSLSA